MKCFIFLITVALANAKVINKNDCGVIVNGIAHEKEYLKDYVDHPYQLALDYNNDVLYFSYTGKGDNVFKLASLNLKSKDFNLITGVEGPFASAVSEQFPAVYFGGSNGIYTLNGGFHSATSLNITKKNIWQIFSMGSALYFTTYPDEEAYVHSGGELHKVTEIGDTKVSIIGVDNEQNIIYSNSSGLFYYTKADKQTIHVGDYVLNSITKDINGNIFFSTPTGIYSIDEKTKSVKTLAIIINIFGMAIEKDGSIIYASDNNIIRLKSTGKDCSD